MQLCLGESLGPDSIVRWKMRKRRPNWAAALSGIACLNLFLVAGYGEEDGGVVAVYIPYVPPPVIPPPGTTEAAEGAAVAGPDQTVARGTTVQPEASARHAPGTADDPEGTDPTTCEWVLTSGPAVTFAPDIASPVFTAPDVDATLVLTLAVDGQYTDTATVNVQKLVDELGEEICLHVRAPAHDRGRDARARREEGAGGRHFLRQILTRRRPCPC